MIGTISLCHFGNLYAIVNTKEIHNRTGIKYQVARACRLLNDYSENKFYYD